MLGGNVGAQGEEDLVVVGSAGRGGVAGGLDGAPDLAPQIDLIAEIERDREAVDLGRRDVDGNGRGQVSGGALAVESGVKPDVREEVDLGSAGPGAALFNAGDGGLDGRAVGEGAGFEGVQFRIVEELPPFALGLVVDGLGGLPGIGGRGDGGDVGRLMVPADGRDARGEAEQQGASTDAQEVHGFQGKSRGCVRR